MHTCMHVCACVYVFACMCMCMYACVCMCVHVCAFACMYTYVYVCVYIYIRICIDFCLYICVCVHIYRCMHVYVQLNQVDTGKLRKLLRKHSKKTSAVQEAASELDMITEAIKCRAASMMDNLEEGGRLGGNRTHRARSAGMLGTRTRRPKIPRRWVCT